MLDTMLEWVSITPLGLPVLPLEKITVASSSTRESGFACCSGVLVEGFAAPPIIRLSSDAGASHAHTTLLRLPGPVKDVFEERLRASLPLRADRVLRRIKETRGGKMNDARFGTRGTGEGPYADAIANLFVQTAEKLGFPTSLPDEGPTTFRRPRGQLGLF